MASKRIRKWSVYSPSIRTANPMCALSAKSTTEGLGEVIGSDGKSHYVCAVCSQPVVVTDKPKN